ncbi:50S ribosomal protein L24 [Mycoplasmatota bacterium]|nr:50S ribosomal protein L24 [Mycoplasmatota bacterium]
MHIKKGDKVQIIAGKGSSALDVTKRQGTVLHVFPKENKVIVEGKNIVKKHTKPNQANQQGGIVEFEAPIHASNVQVLDPVTKKPVRIGHKFVENKAGKLVKVRYTVGKNASGEILDNPNKDNFRK